MFSIDYGDFLNDSLSFGFNTAKQIFLFFACFFTIRDLPDVKRTQSFFHVIFRDLEYHEKKKSTWNATRKKEREPCRPTCWPHGGAHLPHASFQRNLGLHGLVLT
jgi:hypothetical protein